MYEPDDEEESGVFEPEGERELVPSQPAMVIAGRYEIVERIGEGGMGQVVKARHLRLGKQFAIKLMQAEFSVEPEARAIFNREARLASTLSHPNIVSVVDFGEDPDWGLFIVMELLEGELLSSRIETGGPLPVPVACNVASQLTDALRHSHSLDVVHTDLKTDNVICVTDPEGRRHWNVKLLDFGTAFLASAGGPSDRIAGTPEYLAPERIRQGVAQPSVDIYAMGIILYEMLAGSVPFLGGEPREILQRHLDEPPPPIGPRRGEEIDPELVTVVDRALAKDPADRYPDMQSLAEDLQAYMSDHGMRRRAQARRMTTAPGDSRADAAAAAFDAFGLPAAGIAVDGTIVVANRAMAGLLRKQGFDELEGTSILETPIARIHSGLRDDLRVVAMDGKLVRRRLELPRGDSGVAMRLLLTPAQGACGSCVLVLHAIPPAR